MRVYNDPAVMFGRRKTGGLRVDGLSHWTGGAVEVDTGRGQERKFRVDAIGGGDANAPTFEDRRADLVARVIAAGLLDDADAKHGPPEEWDVEACRAVAAWLRERAA